MALTASRELAICDKLVTELDLTAISGLTFTPQVRMSFGFEDGELSTLKVVVRPHDTSFETEERTTERNDYEIEIGMFKLVSRTDTANMRNYFNLSRMFANLFPIDRKLTVDGVDVLVSEKRYFPLINRGQRKGGLDNIDEATTRFESVLILGFMESVATA